MDDSHPTNNCRVRSTAIRTLTATAAAILAVSIATVACGSNSNEIQRANISNLPTPTGGEIFASSDELATQSQDEVAIEARPEGGNGDGTLFEGGGGAAAVQMRDLVADNPEIAELLQRVQSGQASDADLERLNTLMSEFFAEGGPASATGFGFGAQPTAGTIHAVNGNAIEIQPPDDPQFGSNPSATVTIGDETEIIVASEIALADIQVNDTVDVIAIRGEDGIIRAVNVTLADIDDALLGGDDSDGVGATAFGARQFRRLLRGTGLAGPPGRGTAAGNILRGATGGGSGPGPGARAGAVTGRRPGGGPGNEGRPPSQDNAGQQTDAQDGSDNGNGLATILEGAEGIPATGRITKIEPDRLHIEAEQGPLRITIDDYTEFVRIAIGTPADLTPGLSAFALADADGNALTVFVGPENLIDIQGATFGGFAP